MTSRIITHVEMDTKFYNVSLDDSSLFKIPRSKEMEKNLEIPSSFKHKFNKLIALRPFIVGCRVLVEDDFRVIPDGKSIIKHCGYPISPKTQAIFDVDNSCFASIKKAGYPDIALAYQWIFSCHGKIRRFSNNGAGYMNFMVDNNFTIEELMINPYLPAHTKSCSKTYLYCIEMNAVEFNVPFEIRVSECARYFLRDVMNSNGHVCFSVLSLCNIVKKHSKQEDVNDIERDKFKEILSASNYFRFNEDFVYLSHVHIMESQIVEKLHTFVDASLDQTGHLICQTDIDKDIAEFEHTNMIQLNVLQKHAISKLFTTDNILIVTGVGGTGKSSVVAAIQAICATHKLEIDLGSPTGKAACRLGKEAKTLHRLLKIVEEGEEHSQSYAFLTGRVVVVDELSMVDLSMFWHLLKAINPGRTKLVLLGDPNQLPSVRFGSVLIDLIQSSVIPCVQLTKIYRQDKDSTILKLARSVLDKKMPSLRYLKSPDVQLQDVSDESEIQHMVLKLYQEDPNVVIIIPTKKGDTGTRCINMVIKNSLFDNQCAKFISGTRVICIKNAYAKDANGDVDIDQSVYNGQTGYVVKCKRDVVNIKFDSGQVVDLNTTYVDLAYALTVHKTQGDEYGHVCLVLHNSHNIMLQNKVLYTGLTRAKKKLTIISDLSSLRKCITTETAKRVSLMAGLISKPYEVL